MPATRAWTTTGNVPDPERVRRGGVFVAEGRLVVRRLAHREPVQDAPEHAFGKLKAILRKARCRTRDVLWATIGASRPRFEPAECRNYFRHCGYSVAMGL